MGSRSLRNPVADGRGGFTSHNNTMWPPKNLPGLLKRSQRVYPPENGCLEYFLLSFCCRVPKGGVFKGGVTGEP